MKKRRRLKPWAQRELVAVENMPTSHAIEAYKKSLRREVSK